MTAALLFVAGMFAGSILVLVFGALVASARYDEKREMAEVHRKYVDLLERTAFGLDQEDDE